MKPATDATKRHQQNVRESLPFEDRTSFENAERGFLATITSVKHERERDGKVVYDLSQLGFLDTDSASPDTVNPSLWRQCQLTTNYHGLFEVVPGIYQVRGFDLANMTLIQSETGWIVIDPLTSAESSAAALALANQHLGKREVRAVIHTHSHADHFAGVLGVVDAADVLSGKIPVLAPLDYTRCALSENVMAGNVMNRRAAFMFGNLLEPSPQGFVGNGLGPALAMGSTGFVVPNDIIERTGETRTLDGVEIEFQLTPGTEAPTEMVFFFPGFRALCMSEITTHHLHNVYTPRGAQTRDALAWSQQIQESLDLFGERLEVQFGCHHWPTWGREAVYEYMLSQRDLYKFIHDQTLRLANHGFTKEEIAEQLELPKTLAQQFHNRDYYGTVSHNSKAVYIYYLGYFDGHPAHLEPLPPKDAAQRYVKFMGGADNVLRQAQESFDEGEYRWVAQVLHHVVFDDPDNKAACELMADALEQLGYQSESGPWRNFYLTGAQELRNGTPPGGVVRVSEGIARRMPLRNLFDAMAVRLNAERAEGLAFELNVELEGEGTEDSQWLLEVRNSVFFAHAGKRAAEPAASVRASGAGFRRLMLGLVEASELMAAGELRVEGDVAVLVQFGSLFDQFTRSFPILFPR